MKPRLTAAQKELYLQIDATPGVCSQCFDYERRTVDALVRKGMLRVVREYGDRGCEVERAAEA